MRKLLSLLILLTFMLLSACSSASNAENSPTEAPEPTVEVVVEPVETAATSDEDQQADVFCAVQPPMEDFSQENDWMEGAEEGFSVTIIEYGDYQ